MSGRPCRGVTYHKPGVMGIVRMSSQVILICTDDAAAVELNFDDVVVCLPLALQGENHPPLTSAPTLV